MNVHQTWMTATPMPTAPTSLVILHAAVSRDMKVLGGQDLVQVKSVQLWAYILIL